jgi:hypothetical protein
MHIRRLAYALPYPKTAPYLPIRFMTYTSSIIHCVEIYPL